MSTSPARVVRLLALGAVTVLLAAGAWLARDALQQLSIQRRAAADASSRLAVLREAMPEIVRREAYGQLAARANQQAEVMGFDPNAWAERRVNRVSGPVSRVDAGELLRQIDAGDGSRFFAADSFELSVLTREAGLYTPPAYDDKGLVMAFNGTLHFPLAIKP